MSSKQLKPPETEWVPTHPHQRQGNTGWIILQRIRWERDDNHKIKALMDSFHFVKCTLNCILASETHTHKCVFC